MFLLLNAYESVRYVSPVTSAKGGEKARVEMCVQKTSLVVCAARCRFLDQKMKPVRERRLKPNGRTKRRDYNNLMQCREKPIQKKSKIDTKPERRKKGRFAKAARAVKRNQICLGTWTLFISCKTSALLQSSGTLPCKSP